VKVDVRTGVEGVDDEYVQTVAVLADDATAEQITDVIVAFPDQVDAAGFPDDVDSSRLRFELPNHRAALEVAWAEDVDAAAVLAGVRRWLAVTATFEGSLTAAVSTRGPLDWSIQLNEDSMGALATAYTTLRDGVGLVDPGDSWDLTSTAGGRALELTGDTLPTSHEVDVWSQLVAATDRLPAELPASALEVQLLSQRAVIDLTVVAPKGVKEKTFTLERYGAELEPALRTQLGAVDSLRQEWTYSVSWEPADIPDLTHILISLLDKEQPINNHDEPSRWSRWAKDYVDSL
jgi:hypothetical protein